MGRAYLTSGNPKRTDKPLSRQPVEEIWGVGRRISKNANTMGITTALQLAREPCTYQEEFQRCVERTVRELNGESCISLEEAPPPKQQIVCSRSFGSVSRRIASAAVCQYAERAVENCAASDSSAGTLLYLEDVTVRGERTVLRNVASEKLMTPTQDTGHHSRSGESTDRIWVNGHRYAKAGCMLMISTRFRS